MEERLLVKRVKRGDPAAFEELMTTYQARIYALALRMMRNEYDAQDAAQDAMLKIYTHIDSFQQKSAFSTWVYSITRNTCLDALRKKNTYPQSELSTVEFTLPDTQFSAHPELSAEQKELRRMISQCITLLPGDQQAVLVLRDVDGYAYDEICQLLNISEGTLKSRLHRARAKLRDSLKQVELL